MTRAFWWILLAYIAANVALLAATAEGASLRRGADAQSWYEPTVALYQYGAFVELNDPDKRQTYRGPVFPIFGAAMMALAGEAAPKPIVYGQIVLLLLAGLMFRRIVEEQCAGWGDLGLALFIFNPNAFATAHLVQSDTVFLLAATATFWALLRYNRSHDWRFGVATGALLGVTCLVRPTPQFLLLALPLVLPLLVALSGGRGRRLWRAALNGLGGVAAAAVIALPWVLHVHAAGGGFDITPPEIKYRYIWDHIQIMDAQTNGISQWESGRRLEGPDGLVERHIEAQGPGWQTLSRDEQFERLVSFGYETLLSYPPAAIARALAQSVGQYLLGGGAGNYYNLLDIDPEKLSVIWMSQTTGRPLETMRRLFADAPLSVYVISALAFGYVLLMRLTGIVGAVGLVRRRDWPLLAILIGTVAYFALVHVFAGSARYRLVVEPALLLLAVMGIRDGFAWWRRKMAAP